MIEKPAIGGYFSRNYLSDGSTSLDSERMRNRIAVFLERHAGDDDARWGEVIKRELGLELRKSGTWQRYVPWESVLPQLPISDFLNVITCIAKIAPSRSVKNGRISSPQSFIKFVETVFREERIAYRIDEKGGVHPFVDHAFSAQLGELVSGLSAQGLEAARSHVERAEGALLAHSLNSADAVRSIFLAAENIFKLLAPGCTQLNDANIKNYLRNKLLDVLSEDQHERIAAGKLVDSFSDWVNAGHFYRHDPGRPEPHPPSNIFAIQYVSQGICYIRWLAAVPRP